MEDYKVEQKDTSRARGGPTREKVIFPTEYTVYVWAVRANVTLYQSEQFERKGARTGCPTREKVIFSTGIHCIHLGRSHESVAVYVPDMGCPTRIK